MTVRLDISELDMLFPAHMRVSDAGVIVELGPSLLHHLGDGAVGAALFDVFKVERPIGIADFAALSKEKRPLILKAKGSEFLRLRGVALRDALDLRLLLGHLPDIGAREAMQSFQFSDFGPTDGSLDVVLSASVREGLLEDTQRLLNSLEAKKAAAEAANEAKSRFLAQMSHELRTPMNGVMGMLDVLIATGLAPEQENMAKAATQSAAGLLKQLDEILDFSRLEAGAVSLEAIPFFPLDVAREVQTLLTPMAEAGGLRIALSCNDMPTKQLIGDPARIRQIMTNLVSNAIKFTSEGVISILLAWDEAADGGALRLVVKDTGVGIPEPALATLFDRFVQADTSISRKYGGAGLGLAICKQLTELMGGEISVESEEGAGAQFTVRLPAKVADAAAAPKVKPVRSAAPLDAAASQAAGLNILVAEDIAVNQMVIEAMLSQIGHRATIAADGEAAISEVKSGQYDLLLMDVQMPGIDGLEATRMIRALNTEAAGIPIIAMTAHAFSSDRLRCLEAGMDDYLSKPVKHEDLVLALDRQQVFQAQKAG